VSHRQIILEKMVPIRRVIAWALSRTHTILSDRTLIRAPDCVPDWPAIAMLVANSTPTPTLAGERNCGTPEALGYRRTAISLADANYSINSAFGRAPVDSHTLSQMRPATQSITQNITAVHMMP
jgi:hypothetical protein